MNFIHKPTPILARDLMDLPPVRTAMRVYLEQVERVFKDAILRENGGIMPDEATLRAKGHIFITPDGTRHLAWLDTPPVVGEKADFTKVIATVAPMYRYTPERP